MGVKKCDCREECYYEAMISALQQQRQHASDGLAIVKKIGLPAVLEQLAEECFELGKESLKLARLMRGENPTPATKEELLNAIQEETADIRVCLATANAGLNWILTDTHLVEDAKRSRWLRRIEEASHFD